MESQDFGSQYCEKRKVLAGLKAVIVAEFCKCDLLE